MDLNAEHRRCIASGHTHPLAETEICVLANVVALLEELVAKSRGAA